MHTLKLNQATSSKFDVVFIVDKDKFITIKA